MVQSIPKIQATRSLDGMALTGKVFQFAGVSAIWEGVAFKSGIAQVEDGRQQLEDATYLIREETNYLHCFLCVCVCLCMCTCICNN